MKNFIVLICMFSLTMLKAQDLAGSGQTENMIRASTNNNGMGMSYFYKNPNRVIDGSVYLFNEWNNNGVIYTTSNERFAIYNINLNIKRNTFESMVGRDSLFAFNFNNIEKFVINNRVFKNYYWNNDNKVYEVILQKKDFDLLKGFNVKFVEGSSNPMLNRKNDKYIRDEKYYVKKEGKIVFFVLKKSSILKLLNLNDQKKEEVLNYVKANNLSFKNEQHLKQIFDFVYID